MRKFKFLSIAFAAVALASCSSDDLNVAGKYELPSNGSEVLVTVAQPGMRAGFATDVASDVNGSYSQKAFFTEGDVFKMYCGETWAPQVYRFKKYAEIESVNGMDAAIFEFADPDSKYNNENGVGDMSGREYGVFPADRFAFDDEYRNSLTLDIPSYIYLGEEGYPTEVNGITNDVDAKGRKIYKSLIPMFGFCVDNKITFNYMTSLLRIDLMGLTVGKTYALQLYSDYYKLSGRFESTEFDATEGNEGTLPVYETSKAEGNQGDAINFMIKPKESDVVVYLPLPTGLYDLTHLHLYYMQKDTEIQSGERIEDNELPIYIIDQKDEDGDRITCSDYTDAYELKTGTRLLAINDEPVQATVADWVDLNALIAKYANFGRDVELDVTIKASLTKQVNFENVVATDMINVPALKNDITINLSAESEVKLGENGKLAIGDKGTGASTGTLTINIADGGNVKVEVPVQSTSTRNITLGGDYWYTTAVTFKAGSGKVGFDAKVKSPGNLTVESAGELNIGEGATVGTAFVSETAKINIAKGGQAFNLNVVENVPAIVVDGTVGTELAIAEEEATTITLNKAANIAKITVNKKATATITTNATSTIGEIKTEGSNAEAGTYSITANWDADTQKGIANATSINGGKIYTAYQLAGMQKDALGTEINLYANVVVASGVNTKWAPMTVSTNLTFKGNGKSISGLTIDAANDNSGFFGNVRGSLKVEKLALKGLKVVSSADKVAIGGLVGVMNGNVELDGKTTVEITDFSLSGVNKLVGGLVGAILDGKELKITDAEAAVVTVTGTLKGYSQVGGLIGAMRGASKATITVKNNNTEIVKVAKWGLSKALGTDKATEAGTFGMLVGSIESADATFSAGVKNATDSSKNKLIAFTNTIKQDADGALGFANQVAKNTTGYPTDMPNATFVGSTNNEFGFSSALAFNAANGKISVNGEQYAGNTQSPLTSINVFK